MKAKWLGWFSLLVIGFWAIPLVTSAQGYDDRDEDGRGPIEVTNDWRDEVQITMWTHRRERIGGSWTLDPGDAAFLAVERERIKVRPRYKIKVGNDWGWVNVGQVGHFQDGVWYVNVRDVWRATHRDRADHWRDDRDGQDDVPDYLR